MLIKSTNPAVHQILDVCFRFPVSVLSLLGLFFSINIGSLGLHIPGDNPIKIFSFFFFATFFSLTITLAGEAIKASPKAILTVMLPSLAIMGWLISSGNTWEPQYLCGTTVFAFCLSPYILRPATDEQISGFINTLVLRLIKTIGATAILGLGTSALYLVVALLFPSVASLMEPIITPVISFIGIIFAPLYAIAELPKAFDTEKPQHKGVSITTPLILLIGLYTFILYIYIAKILLTWTLPDGGVVWMVLGYSLASLFVYLDVLSWKDTKTLAGFYERWIFYFLVPPLFLLAVGLYERLRTYGLTESRIAVFIFFVCLAVTIGHALTQRGKPIIRTTFLTAITLLLLAYCGPWGATKLSLWDQTRRLHDLLQKHEMLDGERLKESLPKVDEQDLRSFESMLSFLDFRDQFEPLGKLFAIDVHTQNQAEAREKIREKTKDFLKAIKQPITSRKHGNSVRFSGHNKIIDTRGYDYATYFPYVGASIHEITEDKQKISVLLDTAKTQYIVMINNLPPVRIDLSRMIEDVVQGKTVFPPALMLTGSTSQIRVKLIVDEVFIDISKNAEGKPSYYTVSGWVLYTVKAGKP